MRYQRVFFWGGGDFCCFYFALSVVFHNWKNLHIHFDKHFECVNLQVTRQYSLYSLIISKICK